MPTEISFSIEISQAIRALTTCEHPSDKVSGGSCTLCGAFDLPGTGWTVPVRLAALQIALNGGQRIEFRPKKAVKR